MLDLYALYSFIKRLTTPFDQWPAYKLGIIDEKGNILKKQRNTREEKEAFGAWDRTVLRLKKLLHTVPGGDSKIASYAAALYLIRESVDLEAMSEDQMISLKEDIANIVGSGAVAGLGVGEQGEPPVKQKKIIKRSLPFNYFEESEEGSIEATRLAHQKRLKKHSRHTITVAGNDDKEDDFGR